MTRLPTLGTDSLNESSEIPIVSQTLKVDRAALRVRHSGQSNRAPPNRLGLRKNFSWMLFGSIAFALSQWLTIVALSKMASTDVLGSYELGLRIVTPLIILLRLNLEAAGSVLTSMATTPQSCIRALVWSSQPFAKVGPKRGGRATLSFFPASC